MDAGTFIVDAVGVPAVLVAPAVGDDGLFRLIGNIIEELDGVVVTLELTELSLELLV